MAHSSCSRTGGRPRFGTPDESLRFRAPCAAGLAVPGAFAVAGLAEALRDSPECATCETSGARTTKDPSIKAVMAVPKIAFMALFWRDLRWPVPRRRGSVDRKYVNGRGGEICYQPPLPGVLRLLLGLLLAIAQLFKTLACSLETVGRRRAAPPGGGIRAKARDVAKTTTYRGSRGWPLVRGLGYTCLAVTSICD